MNEPDATALPETALAPSAALYGEELGRGAAVGGYVIEELRARGGFGVVYRAVGRGGESAAVKVLHATLAESEPVLRRFQQEVEVIRRIRHPGIVQLFASGDLTDGRPYVVMEWLEGRTLDEALRTGGPLDLATALWVVGELCAALSATHAAGVVHRDLKGSNVMWIGRGGDGARIKLLDFGVAKLLGHQDTKLTSTGLRLGTPSHMAPEQILARRIGPAADVYALGVLLYQALTGQLPFSAETTAELDVMHLDRPPPRVGDFAPVPDGVNHVVQRCLAKEPAQRYASMEELIEDLREAASTGSAESAESVETEGKEAQAFQVKEAQAAGILVGATSAGAPEAAALAEARAGCEAEGWTTAWLGEQRFMAAANLPSSEEGARRLRARALRLALEVVQGGGGADGAARPLSARVHAAPAIVLFVQRMPQIVGGELLAMVDAPVGAPGEVLATGEALAGLAGAFELEPGPPDEPLIQRVRAKG